MPTTLNVNEAKTNFSSDSSLQVRSCTSCPSSPVIAASPYGVTTLR